MSKRRRERWERIHDFEGAVMAQLPPGFVAYDTDETERLYRQWATQAEHADEDRNAAEAVEDERRERDWDDD
jgi:hypothetical protein